MEDEGKNKPAAADRLEFPSDEERETTRRDALKKFAKWTPPAMMTLISASRAENFSPPPPPTI